MELDILDPNHLTISYFIEFHDFMGSLITLIETYVVWRMDNMKSKMTSEN
ncbi:hypothetical protein LWHH1689_0549 [Limosilactobacillus reuteri]|uniref:Uncharacterized protein n=1 Tax=Limosilactobacillus reuteri TaxID=1598 RepID=A0A2S1EPQ0_LIMRT|nr:hypothetical protein [Limosilactobacillus reuteri]AWD61897.1 hypothetical protein LWHH1689_0549 [Limosilactobacillus reuteri]